jgi:hypothetical protein
MKPILKKLRSTARARWPSLVALLMAGMFAWRFVGDWPVMLRYPGEEEHVEGIPLAEMVRLREGKPIYAKATPETFHAANYGPLYFLLGARLVNPRAPAYFPIRVLSMLATVGCAVGCGVQAFWLSRSLLAACLASLMFLSSAFVTRHGLSARADLGAFVLWLSGFLVAYRFRGSRRILWAAPFMLAGFFYKQQFVVAPLAVVLFLALEKRYRHAGEFAGIMVLSVGGLLALFHCVIFPGQAFIQHLIFYNIMPFSLERARTGVCFFGFLVLLPLAVAIAYLRTHREKLLSCYLGCAVALNLLMFARMGSDTNYFLESFAIVCPLVAATMWECAGQTLRAGKFLCLLGGGLTLSLILTHPVPEARDFEADRAMQDFLRSRFPAKTKALGYYTGDLVRAGLDTPITDIFAYGTLVGLGKISEQGAVSQLRRQRFGVIVTYFDVRTTRTEVRPDFILTEPLRQELLRSYQLLATLDLPGPEVIQPQDRFYAWIPRRQTETPDRGSPH